MTEQPDKSNVPDRPMVTVELPAVVPLRALAGAREPGRQDPGDPMTAGPSQEELVAAFIGRQFRRIGLRITVEKAE